MTDLLSEHLKCLDSIVTETMESMAFMEAARTGDELGGDLGETAHWARIEVLEPGPSELALLTSDGLLQDLVASVFGGALEGTSAEAVGADLLAEFANTIAGRFAGELAEEGSPISVGLPSCGRGLVEGPGDWLHYALDDGRVFALRYCVQGKD